MTDFNTTVNFDNMKLGLVLSGGGAKGAYEIGVFKALDELGLTDKITVVSGCSIGAINTPLFAMKNMEVASQFWDNLALSNIDFTQDSFGPLNKNYSDFYLLPTLLLDILEADNYDYTQESLRKLLFDTIDFNTIKKSGITMYACAYDIKGNKPVYFELNRLSNNELVDAVLASAALPFIYPPITIRGRKYTDGAASFPYNSLNNGDLTPIAPLRHHRLDGIIVVRLNNDEWKVPKGFENKLIFDIHPQRPMEIIKGTGTISFTESYINARMREGYEDTLIALSPQMMELVRK